MDGLFDAPGKCVSHVLPRAEAVTDSAGTVGKLVARWQFSGFFTPLKDFVFAPRLT
jgi:hypothetical protein